MVLKPTTAEATVGSRIDEHLSRIYPGLDQQARATVRDDLVAMFGLSAETSHALITALPGADEVMLITYADTVLDRSTDPNPSVPAHPLSTLRELVDGPFRDIVSTVHVLPFFESSGDGGFSVVDYRRIGAGVGDWSDLRALSARGGLMVDLVCNHGSAQSEWFAGFVNDKEPYRRWYVTASPDTDLTQVVRPRTHPLLLEVDTNAGPKHVWATFSHDQVDFDFSNPQVLIEFCDILRHYVTVGSATMIRLDAVAYVWKQLGTPCVHLPETHEIVKLFRTLLDAFAQSESGSNSESDSGPTPVDPRRTMLVTETNVPHAENISYFGDGDEAQVVYNFTLAPLLVWSVLAERSDLLSQWLTGLDAPPPGCTFLNFIASHDGIGLRPIDGLVEPSDLDLLVQRAEEVGGSSSPYMTANGPRPYELNVSLVDLLCGVDGRSWERFVAAHAALLALQGLPAFYIHSLLVTPGDTEAVVRTAHLRDINRPQLDLDLVTERLSQGWRSEVFAALAKLVPVRRAQPAFAPSARQIIHSGPDGVLAVERRCDQQRILALHNLSADSVEVSLPSWAGDKDLASISFSQMSRSGSDLELGPWGLAWLV